METVELKSCPCCNSAVVWCDSIPDDDGDYHECDHIICTGCGLDFTVVNEKTNNCCDLMSMKECVAGIFNNRKGVSK